MSLCIVSTKQKPRACDPGRCCRESLRGLVQPNCIDADVSQCVRIDMIAGQQIVLVGTEQALR